MPISTAVTVLYLLVLAAVMPPAGPTDQYRITMVRDTQSEMVNLDRTPTGFDFSDADGVVMARALTVSALVYNGSSPDGDEKVDLKSYCPTLEVPFPAGKTSASYPTTDGGTLTVTRQGKALVIELSSIPDLALTIEPRGE